MSLDEYRRIDLSREGQAARILIGAASKEAAQGMISLAAEYNADNSYPPYFTKIMGVWYLQIIAGVRGVALQEIREDFAAIDLGKGQRGFLIESAKDEIEQEKFRQIKSERDQFFSNEKVDRTTTELAEAKRVYEQMKAANGGEDADEWSTKFYVLTLLTLALPEIPLNFESFSKFSFLTPAMAMVSVLIMAACIAASSHIVGTTIKQWGELFGGHVPAREKMRAIRTFTFGVTLFTFAMGLITAGRSLLFQEDIQRKLVIGEPLTFSDYMTFGFSVGGNILIWMLGVVVASYAHSHIPGFGAKQKRVRRLQDAVSAMHEKDLEPRVDRHLSKAQHDLANLMQLETRQLRSRPDYIAARARFEALRQIDNQVLAILSEYRSLLADEARKRSNTIFDIEDIESLSRDMKKHIDLSSFEHLKLRLPYA